MTVFSPSQSFQSSVMKTQAYWVYLSVKKEMKCYEEGQYNKTVNFGDLLLFRNITIILSYKTNLMV